jgi:hypothetical protein
MTRIFKRVKKDSKKLKQGFFSLKKYEKWLSRNSTDEEFLLFKLNGDWSSKFDGTSEIRLDPSGEMYVYDFSHGNKLMRYRILESWIEWRKSDETIS